MLRCLRAQAPTHAGGLAAQLRWKSAQAAAGGTPRMMKATMEGLGEDATTLVKKDAYRFLVDEPPKLGGKGMASNPLTYFLGSLVGCTQYTIHMISKEMKLPAIARIAWRAEGEYDLAGVRGELGANPRFQRVRMSGTVDGGLSQEDLDQVAEQAERRCIVAATVKASGADMKLSLTKGSVSHDCEPACELHRMTEGGAGGATGTVKGRVSSEADTPQFSGTAGQGQARARGYHTAAGPAWLAGGCAFRTSAVGLQKDGEDVAREHMQADKTPQLQKETSEQEAPETRGGSYAGAREVPTTQAPAMGGSQEQVAEQASELSGAIHPQDIGTAEGGKPVEKGGAPAPGFTERMMQKRGEQESQLGVHPSGTE